MTLALVIQWLILVRGGYVPFMHVGNLMPWSALLVAGTVAFLAGNRRLTGSRRGGGWTGPARSFWQWRGWQWRGVAVNLVAVSLATLLAISWVPSLR